MNLLFFEWDIWVREQSDRAGVGEGCPPPTVGSFYTYLKKKYHFNSIHIYREESSTLQEHLLNFYAQASDHLKLKYFYMVTYGMAIDLLYFSSSKCISHWYFRTSRCERAPLKIYLLSYIYYIALCIIFSEWYIFVTTFTTLLVVMGLYCYR